MHVCFCPVSVGLKFQRGLAGPLLGGLTWLQSRCWMYLKCRCRHGQGNIHLKASLCCWQNPAAELHLHLVCVCGGGHLCSYRLPTVPSHMGFPYCSHSLPLSQQKRDRESKPVRKTRLKQYNIVMEATPHHLSHFPLVRRRLQVTPTLKAWM